ncbi:hypothetical protein QOT17_012514 [Balamuthia mandrillaris]
MHPPIVVHLCKICKMCTSVLVNSFIRVCVCGKLLKAAPVDGSSSYSKSAMGYAGLVTHYMLVIRCYIGGQTARC